MFCQSCGAQVTGAFCTKCGARAVQPAAPAASGGPPPAYVPPPPPPPPQYNAPPPQYAPQPQPYVPPQPYQPLPPADKSGSGLKVLFVVLGVLGVLGMMAIGAVWYGWHVVKQTAASKGIDLDGITETSHGPARRINACDLLPKEELSQLLKMNIERTEGGRKSTHSTCAYYSSAAVDASTTAATDAIERIKENKSDNTPADQEKALKEVGNIVRGISGAAANGLVVSIEVETENPKAAMAGMKIAMAAMTGGEKNNALREDIKGVGDEAIMGPLASIFLFRKGDVAVTIDGRALPGGREAQIAIGKAIAGKL